MANLNKVMLIGRLTRDPELRHTPSGTAVADFGFAVNHFKRGPDGSRQEEPVFIEITAWEKQAELVHQYLNKGKQVFIEGRLQYDAWTTPEGQKRSKLKVVAESIQFLDSKSEGGAGAPRQAPPANQQYSGGGGGSDDYGHGGGYSDGSSQGGDNIPF